MKTHHIIYIIIAMLFIAAAAVAMTYFVGTGSPAENHGTAAIPASEPHSNLNYFTANSSASQENAENTASVTTEPPESSLESGVSPENNVEIPAYTVKVFDGKIGVFEKAEGTPVEILDIDVDILPEEDRSALTEGIAAETKSELRRILEDYES